MPPRRNGLTDEPRARELLRAAALHELDGGDAVARGGERLLGVLGVVGREQPGGRVDRELGLRDLRLEGFGEEKVYAGAQVLEKGGRAAEAGGGGD